MNLTNEQLVLAMALVAKQANSGSPFSMNEFARDVSNTVLQFPCERQPFTFSAQRYEIEVEVGGRGRDRYHSYCWPEEFKNRLVQYYSVKKGKERQYRIGCESDSARKIVKKKERFLLAKPNFENIFSPYLENSWGCWSRGSSIFEECGFVPATATELSCFRVSPLLFSKLRIWSLEQVYAYRGNHTKAYTGYVCTKFHEQYRDMRWHIEDHFDLNLENDYVLLKEI